MVGDTHLGTSRRHILGVRVDDVDWDQTMAALDEFFSSGQPHQVVTPNPEFIMRARHDMAFRAVLESADLAPADGVGVCWAGSLLGQPVRQVVPGSELVWRLAESGAAAATRSGTRVRAQRWFLLGAAEGVAAAAGEVLARKYPGLVIAGTFAGSPDPAADDEQCHLIEAAAPVDLLLVAFGAPAQELWIARNQPRLRIPVATGVGGAFNFVAGRSRRPPGWMKRVGLIWLFRLVTEPWRWRRQLVLVQFVGAVLGAAAGQRFNPNSGRTTS